MPVINDEWIAVQLREKIISESGFGRFNPAMRALETGAPGEAMRRDPALCRYSVMLAPHNDMMSNYNGNNVISDKLWTGEGPAKSARYSNVSRFMSTVLFNKDIDFKHIIALGPEFDMPANGYSFFPYFRDIDRSRSNESKPYLVEDETGYSLETERPETRFNRFTEYQLTARAPSGDEKKIQITHFQDMEDMQALNTSPAIIAKLLMLAEVVEKEAVFMHCSAGLGRSGTIAYAFMIYGRFEALVEYSSEKLVDELFNMFNSLNELRPGSVQVPEQIQNALDIAQALFQLKQQLLIQKQSIGEYLDKCVDYIDSEEDPAKDYDSECSTSTDSGSDYSPASRSARMFTPAAASAESNEDSRDEPNLTTH